MNITVLGAGTPTPTKTAFGSGQLLDVAGRRILIDCGPGTTMKLARMDIRPTDVTDVLFTHHHFDHNADYGCFLVCRWDQAAGNWPELKVYGPQQTVEITDRLIGERGAFAFDIDARVNAPVSQTVYENRGGILPRRRPAPAVTDIGVGIVLDEDGLRVTSAPALHVQPWLDSLAYRVDSDEGSIVFTGDTEPCDTVVELARGADTLVCMCWETQERMVASGESNGQCGAGAAAAMAREAGVGRLVLTHLGPRLGTDDGRAEALHEAIGEYDGEIVFASELSEVELEPG